MSFDIPEYTADRRRHGHVRLLEAIRRTGLQCRFYQASSSEMFGSTPPPQSENYPVSSAQSLCLRQGLRPPHHGQLPRKLWPARLLRHPVQPRIAAPRRNVRHAQDHHAPWRVSSTACRTSSISAISRPAATGDTQGIMCAPCGSCCSRTSPDDYVIGTGESHTVREFVEVAFAHAGSGLAGARTEIDPRYFRPAEVDVSPRRCLQSPHASWAGSRT